MSWKEGFYAALLEFVRTELGKTDWTEITSVETAAHEGIVYSEVTAEGPTVWVEFAGRDNTGRNRWCEWEGDFGELISRLTDKEE